MSPELLRFINRTVRIRQDISHQEYVVLGILWDTKEIILATDKGSIKVPYTQLDIIQDK